jgi:hypothetical protein
MSHDGFRGHTVYSGGGHQWPDRVYSAVLGMARLWHHYLGFAPTKHLILFLFKTLGLRLFNERIQYRSNDANLQLCPAGQTHCPDDQLNNQNERFSRRFLESVFVVGLLWGALAGWLTIVQALHNVVFGNVAIVDTVENSCISKDASTAHTATFVGGRYGTNHSSPHTPLATQMFNPAFGSARLDVPGHRYFDKDILCATVGKDPDDECMLGQISMPSQSPESTEQTPAPTDLLAQAPTPPPLVGSRFMLAQRLESETQTELAKLPNEKPKPKLIIINR